MDIIRTVSTASQERLGDELDELRRLRRPIEDRGKITNRDKNPSHARLVADPDLLDWL